MVPLPVRLLVWGLVRWAPWLLLLGWGGLALAQGVAPLPARAVVNPTVAPAAVKIGVASKVRIHADIGDPNVIAAGVNLLKVGAAGTNPTIVGVLTHEGIRAPDAVVDFVAAWLAHLAVLAGRLDGRAVRDFWAEHERAIAVVSDAHPRLSGADGA